MKLLLLFLCATLHASLPDISKMSLEEKVGQLMMVHFNGTDLTEEAQEMIDELHVGSIIYYKWANGLDCPSQVSTLSSKLHGHAKIPLLIAVDQEGGASCRLENGFFPFPGNRALGETGNLLWAKESAKIMGDEMRSVGIHLNLAPVVDVAGVKHSAIGIRSFGSSSEKVISFAEKMIEGFHEAKIFTTLKHFPGLGKIGADTHEILPRICDVEEDDLLPFYVLAKKSDMVMTAHLIVESWDRDNCVTLSKKALRGILREKMGFQGVIISDSLMMEGLLSRCENIEEAAIRAFEAGCDILLLGGKLFNGSHAGRELHLEDFKRVHRALCDAFQKGKLSLIDLDTSVSRIFLIKDKIENRESQIIDNQALAKKISRSAIQIIKKGGSLKGKRVLFLEGTKDEKIVGDYDHLVIFSENAWRDQRQQERIRKAINTKIPVTLICLRDPEDADLFPMCEGILATLSPTNISREAAIELLY